MSFLKVHVLLIGFFVCLGSSSGDYNNRIETNIQSGNAETSSEPNKSNLHRSLKRVYLNNATITCNDGSQAGFYLRKSIRSTNWVVFLEGGWYCYNNDSCNSRWSRLRHMMTSSNWTESREVGGILSTNSIENPYFWKMNHVYVPYCTSDFWSGTMKKNRTIFSFLGAMIVRQVITDLVPLGLENAAELVLAGSSAGGIGVMLNLDSVRELLNGKMGLNKIKVRGVSDSGWFLDHIPYSKNGFNVIDSIKTGMEYWQGNIPENCRQKYKEESWFCYLGYRLQPFLQTPLFIFQWLFDEAQMKVDNIGAPITPKHWDYVQQVGKSLLKSFENVSAVFAPSCISHSVLSKNDWGSIKIQNVSFMEALHCWLKRISRGPNQSSIGSKLNIRKKQKRHLKKNKKLKKQIYTISNETMVENNMTRFIKRSGMKKRMHHKSIKKCQFRLLERCSWPQCNHSCPRLHNPFTGEEVDFLELLESFGLSIRSFLRGLRFDYRNSSNRTQPNKIPE